MIRSACLARLAAATLVPCLLVSAAPARAEAKAEKHPDFTGFWNLGPPPRIDQPDLVAKLPPDTVVVDDTGVKEFGSGDYGALKLKPEALAKAKTWKPEDEMTLTRVCASPSTVYAMQGPFPFEIYQTPQLIVFKYEYFDQVRLIFMDGRAHPPADAPHSKTGHSVGHWEGDELVIDTTHFVPATITNNGLDHSDKIHMIERYKLSADGKSLIAIQWFEDPEVLENRGARFIRWDKKPGQYVFPYDCDPSLAVEYQKTEEGTGGKP